MKIAIAGAHGVGKSTLQTRLKKILKNKPILIPDLGRICPLLTGLETTSEAQKWILSRQLQIENAFDYSSEIVIFDNVSLAHYAYYHRKFGDNPDFEYAAVESCKRIDKIIYLPPTEGFLVHDGLRPTEIEFQTSIYNHQIELFKRHSIEIQFPETGWQSWSNSNWTEFLKKIVIKKETESVIQRVVALGLVEKDGKILLIRRNNPNNPEAHNKWDIPGGTVEPFEPLLNTAVREVLEETGYFVKPKNYHGNPAQNVWVLNNGEKLHITLVCIRCELLSFDPIIIPHDEKISEIRWFFVEELKSLDLIKGIRQYLYE